jgi:hypothetical protein
MRYRTVTERIGECLGPIDWSFDFHASDWEHGGSLNPQSVKEAVERLRQVEADPGAYLATTDGGWPRVGWHRVLQVGMYDGWPYWRPYPSVKLEGTLGHEWHSYHSITEIMRKKAREATP